MGEFRAFPVKIGEDDLGLVGRIVQAGRVEVKTLECGEGIGKADAEVTSNRQFNKGREVLSVKVPYANVAVVLKAEVCERFEKWCDVGEDATRDVGERHSLHFVWVVGDNIAFISADDLGGTPGAVGLCASAFGEEEVLDSAGEPRVPLQKLGEGAHLSESADGYGVEEKRASEGTKIFRDERERTRCMTAICAREPEYLEVDLGGQGGWS